MGKWQLRSVVYILTLVFMYFIFLVYALAFSIPTWLGSGQNNISGLWASCIKTHDSGGFETCWVAAFGDGPDWMEGVRGLWVAGMFFYVLAVLYSLVENSCTREDSNDYGLTGILAILAGLCGAVGVIVVAIKVEEPSKQYSGYFWGYMLACITSGLTLILAIILLITKNLSSGDKSRDDRTADYVFSHKQPNPYAQEYTNHGYNGDVPLANGVTYHHTPTAHPYTTYQDGYNGGNYPPARSQEPVYGQPNKGPYAGYYNGRPGQLHDGSDVGTPYTDLSNGYTPELINAEHTLTRPGVAQRADYVRGGGEYTRPDYPARNDYFSNGSRPY